MVARGRGAGAIAALAACLAACRGGPAVPCTNMDAPSALVTAATLFRVDVYPTTSHCADAGGPSGAPIFTRSFAAGAPIKFDVDAGRRPVVLVAFADAGATTELGRACAEAELGEGRAVCLDLRVEAAPDLAMELPDLAGTAPDLAQPLTCDEIGPTACGATGMCCESLCRDIASDIAHCGGCRACASTNVATPSCGAGLCTSSCASGFGNCAQPAAPAADDGCETNLDTTVGSCGGCGRACGSANVATAACAGGLCTSTCAPGFANCTKPAAPAPDDGCETGIASSIATCGGCARACSNAHVQTASCASGVCTSTCESGYVNCGKPAAPAADDGCECAGNACCPGNTCQTSHPNGLGNTFLDCVALGTHDLTQATAAASAWPLAGASPFNSTACTNGAPMRCVQNAANNMCACWGYSTGAINPGDGRVHLNTASNGCMCPTAGDPAWN